MKFIQLRERTRSGNVLYFINAAYITGMKEHDTGTVVYVDHVGISSADGGNSCTLVVPDTFEQIFYKIMNAQEI